MATQASSDAPRVLVVDDEAMLADLLSQALRHEGWETATAKDGLDALAKATSFQPDVVILDVQMPRMDGLETLKRLRARDPELPVLFLTARDAVADRVQGLRAGADDYVTKPFDPDEVAARIHAVLRRAAGASAAAGAGGVCPDDEALVHRDLRLDVARRRVTLGDAEVALTAHEFDILHVLMRSPDKVFSRELLYELVWKNGYYGEQNAVNVHVSNIRKKLAAAGGAGDYIKTVWGIGFKLA